MNLYQLSNEYQLLLEKDEYDIAEMEALENLSDNIEDKAIAISHHIKNMEAEMNAIICRQKDMGERAMKLDKKIESLQDYLHETLKKCKIDKINKCPDFVISIKTNPPSVYIEDEDKVPKNFFKEKMTISLDKSAIKSAIDSGTVIPGVSIIRKTRLEIK